MMGRNQEAYQCLLTALAIDPFYMTCWFTKAVVEYNAGQHARAMRSFQEVLSYPGDLPQDSLQQAQAAMQSLEASGVQPVEREALGWAAEGTLRGREGQFARALPCFEKALELDPQLPIAWHYKSCALLKLNRLEDALVCDAKALELDAANPELWHQRGLTLKHLRRHEEALACYDQALELEKRNPAYWSDRGLVLGTLERHEDAVSSLERAIALAPQAAAPWLNKALSEETLNRDADAIESYKRFLELASPDLLSHIQHANLRGQDEGRCPLATRRRRDRRWRCAVGLCWGRGHGCSGVGPQYSR
jgi:tetratricopeptide (TPR) repeat protein